MDERDISNDLAIVAVAGRFPGASNPDELWQNLVEGKLAAEALSDEEMAAAGVDESDLQNPNYVKVGNILEGEDRFDAGFFDLTPREARLVDPQQRLFMECAWEVLETAGYAPSQEEGRIGVMASVSANEYFEMALQAADDPILGFEARISNDKDFIATRVGYKLGLRGPCVTVQTACSSSLVAVHMACQTLLNGEADMMLAGGSTVRLPQRTGYLYEEGFILSPDGYCKAFDAAAKGCNGGNGVGVVLLKRLEDALEDGDTVWAVIRASAINNDGHDKVGFTAPSVEGQAAVISEALSVADVHPETIQYIEAHGTGTKLGDPIEVSALTKVYRAQTDRVGYCALGSVKVNIGHLDAAAGVVGLIKAAMVLRHGVVPPSPYFETPNPELDMENSPFVVHRQRTPLERLDHPRRAAVSAFGIGGTNAHVILEEAPRTRASGPSPKEVSLLPFSARSEKALEAMTDRLADALEADPELSLPDAAFTLQQGRQRFEHRRAVVAADRQEVIDALRQRDAKRMLSLHDEATGTQATFLFPGGGTQYLYMGRDLYRGEPVFREHFDICCGLLVDDTGFDPRHLLFPPPGEKPPSQEEMERTSKALPALFAVEYAMAQLFMSFGIEPRALIGHSLGEYTAACLAGVFSLEDALRLVSKRGELFERLPEGAMLSVPLSEEDLEPHLNGDLSIAALNGTHLSVASGSVEAIEALRLELEGDGLEVRRLHIAVAAHSHLVESILEEFEVFVRTIELHAPQRPLLSNVEGTWATEEMVTQPEYWVRHLRQTVRFGQGLETLLQHSEQVLLEIGPGRTLSHFATQAPSRSPRTRVSTTMRHPKDQRSDLAFFYDTLAKLWLYGVDLDWQAIDAGSRRRVPLPTYPFQHQSLMLRPRQPTADAPRRRRSSAETLWLPVWRRSAAIHQIESTESQREFLVLPGTGPLADPLVESLEASGGRVMRIAQDRVKDLIPAALPEWLQATPEPSEKGPDPSPLTVVSLLSWGPTPASDSSWSEELVPLERWIPALAGIGLQRPVRWVFVSSRSVSIMGESLDPGRAALAALLDPLHLEFPHLELSFLDLSASPDGTASPTELRALVRELRGGRSSTLALRGPQRWVPGFESIAIPEGKPATMSTGSGACLLLGFGALGSTFAKELINLPQNPLVVVTRRPIDPATSKGELLQALRAQGRVVDVEHGDLDDASFLEGVVERLRERHGGLTGIVYAAGPGGAVAASTFETMDIRALEASRALTEQRLRTLEGLVAEAELDFCLIHSCMVSLAGGLGGAAAALEHRYLEAWVATHNRRASTPWTVVTWDAWDMEGSGTADALTPDDGIQALRALLALDPQESVVVSHRDIEDWLNDRRQLDGGEVAALLDQDDRPELTTPYVEATHELEEQMVELFQELLGISKIGIHDNFFELGGSSLMAAKVISRMREQFGVAPPLAKLFEEATPAGLAGLIALAEMASAAPDTQTSDGVEPLDDSPPNAEEERELGEL